VAAEQDVTREPTGKGKCDVKSSRCLTCAQLTYSSPALTHDGKDPLPEWPLSLTATLNCFTSKKEM